MHRHARFSRSTTAAATPPSATHPAQRAKDGGVDAASPDGVADDLGATFEPGDVFAGRYRMIARIGRGGMGDVWRADDLMLQTPVALKLIRSSGPEGRERILNEVRLARQITHPAVCRVFDVGESDGTVFFSMELIQGEDLASLLRRVGRLPSEKVADIGRQLCAGVAAAHAKGVLHRDLKPANVLIDDNGHARITDFGIAISRVHAGLHTNTGTPGYMAPEQRVPGVPLSERTDIYALGLILYELLVGRHPASLGADIPAPSTLVPHLDPDLESLVMLALSPDPASRPASVVEMLARLPDATAFPSSELACIAIPKAARRTSWLIAGASAAALVLLIGAAASRFRPLGAAVLTERDTIVVADFENTTGDPVFDGALKVALAVALEQSPFLKVFPDDRARNTLRFMERSPSERITRSIAREIAQREQLKALLAGSIVSLGRNYVVALEAINAETGDVMAREQAEARSKEQVLTSLGQATSRLRRKLGESLASIQRFDTPLPKATTPSLEALHAYALALDDGRAVPRLEAIPHLKRAIELDPSFAMAHALLSGVYANTDQSALAPAFSRRAFELRDRVSERERFFISWRYYRDAVQAWDKALDLAKSWTATYPREAFAFNGLGAALVRFGQFDGAVEPFRTAIALDPRFTPAYSNLAAALLALNRFDEANLTLRQAAERRLDFIGARRISYLLAFVRGDSDTMTRELQSSVGVRETNAAFGWQAHASAFAGRVQEAHDQFRRGVQMALQGNFQEVAARLSVEDAETHAIVRQCAEARNEAAAALGLSRDNLTLERASRAYALCGGVREASTLSSELAKRFPDATMTIRVSLPVTAAALAVQRGDAARALEALEPVKPYDHAPSAEFWPVYLRGQAYLLAKDGLAAALQFQSIVDHRGEVPASPLYPLAHLGLARAAMLANDPARARAEYERMLAFWREGDGASTLLNEARQEHGRIRRVPPALDATSQPR